MFACHIWQMWFSFAYDENAFDRVVLETFWKNVLGLNIYQTGQKIRLLRFLPIDSEPYRLFSVDFMLLVMTLFSPFVPH